uniref:Uncharacterized protein n=1 Tax=Euplotes crassus TaxID=5936 RepID=A0A7S3KJG0_EUPCR|mmetsp:Transcript_30854/g.30400  ORF Transcript_30854/g.30400 Transcript_30854/m.30400 type:complete len:217 (+) Transcript_30854:906-1556(+)
MRDYSYTEVNALHKSFTGSNKPIGPETQLVVKLNEPEHVEFIKAFHKRMPKVDTLRLKSLSDSSEAVVRFMKNYFPESVREFSLNAYSELNHYLPFYMNALETISSKVERSIIICNFEVTQKDLTRLLSLFKHKTSFSFTNCKLLLSTIPRFGSSLAGSTLTTLDLTGCGKPTRGNWKVNSLHLNNLIAGLLKDKSVNKNLQWIGFDGYNHRGTMV